MRIPHSAFLSIGTMLVFICMVGSRPMAQDPWYEQSVQRDMTGDGEPETLVLRADGPAADRLTVTFTIQGSTGRLYRTQWKSQFYFVYTPPSLDKTEPDAVERYVRKFFTGFFDDLMNVPPGKKFVFQLVAASVVYFGGFRIFFRVCDGLSPI